MQYLYTAFIAV